MPVIWGGRHFRWIGTLLLRPARYPADHFHIP